MELPAKEPRQSNQINAVSADMLERHSPSGGSEVSTPNALACYRGYLAAAGGCIARELGCNCFSFPPEIV